MTVTANARVAAVLRTFAAAAAVTLALSGCSSRPSQEQGTKLVRPSDLLAVEGPAPIGKFYVKAGANSLDADLYEIHFSPPRQERITTEARVSTLDGCAGKVVVSAAQKDVGLTDHLQELQGNRLVPVEKLGCNRVLIRTSPTTAESCTRESPQQTPN